MKTLFINTVTRFLISALSVAIVTHSLPVVAQDDAGQHTYKLKISFFSEDSLRKIKAVVYSTDSIKEKKPIKDAEVKFYAKRSFGLLPLGDAQTTDENGEAFVDFPSDLPGDSIGNIEVISKVEENEELGDLEDHITVKWGIPSYVDPKFRKRALWGSAANAPLPLVITVTSMVLLVWGVIFYIILLLVKIPKS